MLASIVCEKTDERIAKCNLHVSEDSNEIAITLAAVLELISFIRKTIYFIETPFLYTQTNNNTKKMVYIYFVGVDPCT